MIDEPTDNAAGNTRKAGSSDRRYFVIAAIILMVDFIRLLSPADELPSSTVRMMSILIELCLVIGLVGLGIKILCAGAMDRSLSIFFLAVGVIAGLGIFGIRLSGGPRVELPSRATGSSTRLEGLPKQLHEQIKSYTELAEKLQTNAFVRTLQKNRTELQSIPHPDIREARELFGQLRDSRERILQLLTEADSQKINLSSPFPERGLIQKEFWHSQQRLYGAAWDKLSLIDQNWNDWVAIPIPENENELKPWQREVKRLDGEINAAQEESKAIAGAKTP